MESVKRRFFSFTPGGLSQLGSCSRGAAGEQATSWRVDGLEQHLAMRRGAWLRQAARAPRPPSSQEAPCGCGALSSCAPEAPRARQSPARPLGLRGRTAAGERTLVGLRLGLAGLLLPPASPRDASDDGGGRP